jgi:hypothetical protein
MTEQDQKSEENQAEDKPLQDAPSNEGASAAAFIMPPFRERVHSRRLQQTQAFSESAPAAAAPIENPTENLPDLNSYFSRTPARGLPTYVPPAQELPVEVARENTVSDFDPPADLVSRAIAELRAQPQENSQPALQLEPQLEPQLELQAESQPVDSFASQFFVQESVPAVDPREAAYIAQQELALTQPYIEEKPPAPPCRHEYVRIFQRKLKDLNRRMVCTKAYLPTGFKMGDFQHLGENSFCFCAKCRARLYPKRSQAEKAEARVQLAQSKALKLEQQSMLGADLIEEVGATALKKLLMHVDSNEDDEDVDDSDDENSSKADVHVEEMETEAVEVEDLDVDGLKGNQGEEDGELFDQEES